MTEFTVATAREAAARDDLATWVHAFLGSPGSDNAPLGDQLRDAPLHWAGPILVPLDELHRLAGPPGHPVMEPTADHEWRDDVDELADAVAEGHEPAPVVTTHRDGRHVLEDGNHRVEALRRAGEAKAWTVVGFASAEERDAFIEAAPGA